MSQPFATILMTVMVMGVTILVIGVSTVGTCQYTNDVICIGGEHMSAGL